jgi:hypothetical protein
MLGRGSLLTNGVDIAVVDTGSAVACRATRGILPALCRRDARRNFLAGSREAGIDRGQFAEPCRVRFASNRGVGIECYQSPHGLPGVMLMESTSRHSRFGRTHQEGRTAMAVKVAPETRAPATNFLRQLADDIVDFTGRNAQAAEIRAYRTLAIQSTGASIGGLERPFY